MQMYAVTQSFEEGKEKFVMGMVVRLVDGDLIKNKGQKGWP